MLLSSNTNTKVFLLYKRPLSVCAFLLLLPFIIIGMAAAAVDPDDAWVNTYLKAEVPLDEGGKDGSVKFFASNTSLVYLNALSSLDFSEHVPKDSIVNDLVNDWYCYWGEDTDKTLVFDPILQLTPSGLVLPGSLLNSIDPQVILYII